MADARIVGRFMAVVADTPDDADESPDHVPLAGTITLTPSATSVLMTHPEPVTFVTTPIVATLDAQGYISHNGKRGIYVLAPDESTNPTSWTYKVQPTMTLNGKLVQYPSWNIEVAPGEVVDLTLSAPVPSSTGTSITQGVSVQSARSVNGELILTLSNGYEMAPVPLPRGDKGERGFAAPDSGMRRSPTSYRVGPGADVIVPHEDIPTSGTFFMSIDGNSPLPIWIQVYRAGAYNGVKLVSPQANAGWSVGETSEPTTGSWKIWVDGTGVAPLRMKTTASYARTVRFFWFDLYQGDGSMGGSNQGVTIRDIYPTTASLPTTGNIKGDAVLVNETGRLHVWSGTAWSAGSTIQGPRGVAGPQGDGVSAISMIPATALPNAFPQGISIMESDNGGYPAQFAAVETVRYGVNRSWQTVVERTTGRSWRRTPMASDAGWNAWIEWGAAAPSDAVYLTQAQYDALATKDSAKTYYIMG